MLKKIMTGTLACLLALTQASLSVLASTQEERDARAVEQAKVKVNRAGLGEKARVTVTLKDGTKRKGYVAERRDTEFVLRDRKTDAPTVIRYADASKVHLDRGHSTARNTAIGVGIGAGAVITVLAVLFASIDD